jgi:DNA polymerase III subunit epsilon
MYAVVDTETTGLNPGRHDRIVEVAVVLVDSQGHVERTWSTLVNPQRDLGPQHIHGISAADARRAPTFGQVAGHLAQLLNGRTLVAHNLPFDAMFLASEFGRLGSDIPRHQDIGLCTMRLAGLYLPSGRSLADCCLAAGVPLDNAHCALDDATAAAGLLRHYIDLAGRPTPWAATLAGASGAGWPQMPTAPLETVGRSDRTKAPAHFLSRLVVRLPRVNHPQADSYLDLLDRALLDRVISDSEADALVAYADHLGLGRLEVTELHQKYIEALAAVAWADGVVTDDEHEDLVTVTGLVGLSVNDLDAAMKTAENGQPATSSRYGRFGLAAGDVIVLTGTFREPKESLEARAAAVGVICASSVSKKIKLVVAADVDSMSGKAEKARQYGIPVVGEHALDRLLAECRP